MAKTEAVYGLTLTPELINSLLNHNHLGENEDNSMTKISNAELSDASGQIKSDFYNYLNELKVVASGNALEVVVQPGFVFLSNYQSRFISLTAVGLLDNASQLICINSAGAVERVLNQPPGSVLLARVTTTSGAVVQIQDLRSRTNLVLPNTSGQAPLAQGSTSTGQNSDNIFELFQDIASGSAVSVRSDGRIVKTNPTNFAEYIGVLQAPGFAGDFKEVALAGQVDSSRSSLTPGVKYYLQYTNNALILAKTSTSFYIGKAIRSTSLLLASI